MINLACFSWAICFQQPYSPMGRLLHAPSGCTCCSFSAAFHCRNTALFWSSLACAELLSCGPFRRICLCCTLRLREERQAEQMRKATLLSWHEQAARSLPPKFCGSFEPGANTKQLVERTQLRCLICIISKQFT